MYIFNKNFKIEDSYIFPYAIVDVEDISNIDKSFIFLASLYL